MAHKLMSVPHKPCDMTSDDEFYKQGGITNGAAWYSVKGGKSLIQIYQTRQISQICPFINCIVRSSNSLLCKGPVIWNAVQTCIQQSHSLKHYVISPKSIVVRGFEDLVKP